jgi:hypothetical protein
MLLNNAIRAADEAHARIHKEIGKAKNAQPLTDAEKAASHKARMEAMSSLNSTIALVQGALFSIENSNADMEKKRKQEKQEQRFPSISKRDMVPRAMFSLTSAISASTIRAAPSDSIDSVKKSMSADGLKPTTQTLVQMAEAIEPVITNFDQILVRKAGPSSRK